VPTEHGAKVAHAVSSIRAEGFDQWIGASSASGADGTFDYRASGFAIAVNRHMAIELPVPNELAIGGRPIHVRPWGPLLERLSRGADARPDRGWLDKAAAATVHKVAAAEIAGTAQASQKQASQPTR
jgi:hypothetical protein